MSLVTDELSKASVKRLPERTDLEGQVFIIHHKDIGIALNPLWCEYIQTITKKDGAVSLEFALCGTKWAYLPDDNNAEVVKTANVDPYTVVFLLAEYGDSWKINALSQGYW